MFEKKKKPVASFDTTNRPSEKKKSDGKKYHENKHYTTGRKK